MERRERRRFWRANRYSKWAIGAGFCGPRKARWRLLLRTLPPRAICLDERALRRNRTPRAGRPETCKTSQLTMRRPAIKLLAAKSKFRSSAFTIQLPVAACRVLDLSRGPVVALLGNDEADVFAFFVGPQRDRRRCRTTRGAGVIQGC